MFSLSSAVGVFSQGWKMNETINPNKHPHFVIICSFITEWKALTSNKCHCSSCNALLCSGLVFFCMYLKEKLRFSNWRFCMHFLYYFCDRGFIYIYSVCVLHLLEMWIHWFETIWCNENTSLNVMCHVSMWRSVLVEKLDSDFQLLLCAPSQGWSHGGCCVCLKVTVMLNVKSGRSTHLSSCMLCNLVYTLFVLSCI
jgi:hypothetical protein